MRNGKKIFAFIVLAPVIIAAYIYAFQYLWNWLMPSVFSLREISLLESLGFIGMAKLLFMTSGGWKKCGSNKCCGSSKHKHGNFKASLKDHFCEKYSCCDDEEVKTEAEEENKVEGGE